MTPMIPQPNYIQEVDHLAKSANKRHNLELWNWKCSDNKTMQYIQNFYNLMTKNNIITRMTVCTQPGENLKNY